MKQSPYDTMVKSVLVESVSELNPRVASIQLSRPSMFFGILKTTPIKFNGRKIGSLGSGGSMVKFVTPGHLRLHSNYTVRPMDLEVKGGHEYLIEVNPKKGAFILVRKTLVMAPPEPSAKISQGTIRPMPTLTPIVKKTPPKTQTELVGLESPPDTGFGRYYALVIGNDNYQHLPKLRTAQNDAKVVAQILGQNYGYCVNLILDARRADILIALGKFRETLTDMDNLLIYYAGHGWLDQEGNEGYWLPVDAAQDNEVQWVSNASITTVLKAMPAKHVLIVADSCYSGKLARGIHIKRKTSNYFARMASKKARSVIASGGLEPVIDSGGKGGHSVFATAFIEALKANEKIIDGTELFTQIRRPVILNSDQTPEYADIRKAGHEGGDFLFVRWK
ncbi:MAG: caspase family protein [Desulfobacterales bacterium]